MPKVVILSGVYSITNCSNGKVYIGSTTKPIYKRFAEHRRCLRRGKHSNRHLQSAWNQYGEEVFRFDIVEYALPDGCISAEQRWLDYHHAANPDFGYNIREVAESNAGITRTPEATEKQRQKMIQPEMRAKLSAAQKGREVDTLERLRKWAAHRGKKIPKEAVEKTAAAHRGMKRSAETKAKISAAMRKRNGGI